MTPLAQRLAALMGGLLLAGGGTAAWVVRETVREVGGARIPTSVAVAGTQFAPAALPLGIAVLLVAGATVLVPGRARRAAGLVLLTLGAAGVAAVLAGLPDAVAAEGALRAAPWAALTGALLAGAAGAGGLRARRGEPVLGERYTVEGAAADDEWSLAAEEGPDAEEGRGDGG